MEVREIKVPYKDLRKRERNRERWMQKNMVLCKCGCGRTRPEFDGHGRRAYYIVGHSGKGEQNGMYGKYGPLHPCYRGAESISTSGYIVISVRGRTKYKHVLVFENHYKCCMLKWGIVHHIDSNTLNNAIENLEGMIRSKHQAMHSKMKYDRCSHDNVEELMILRCTGCGSFRGLSKPS